MTIEDIANNKPRIPCFWCGSLLSVAPKANFVALCGEEGVIQIKSARTGQVAPMVFCSSDCMVYDSKLRYEDRVARGAFRKEFSTAYNDRVPGSWKEEGEVLISGNK